MLRTLSALLILSLSGCSGSDYWFGSEKKVDLAGERIPVFAMAEFIETSKNTPNIAAPLSPVDWSSSGYPNNFTTISNLNFDFLSASEKFNKSLGTHNKFGPPSSPAVAENNIYGWDNGEIVSIDAVSGHLNWRSKIAITDSDWLNIFDSKYQGGGISYDNSVLYITNGLSDVVAINATDASLLWKVKLPTTVRAIPLSIKDKLIIQTLDGKIYGLSKADGKILWNSFGYSDKLVTMANSSAAEYNGLAIVQSTSGDVTAYNPANGEEKWSIPISEGVEVLSTKFHLQNFIGHPVIKNNIIYAYGADGIIAAIDPQTQSLIWRQKHNIRKPVWVSGNVIYAISSDTNLIAIDTTNGKIFWQTDLKLLNNNEEKVVYNSPILLNSELLVVSSNGKALFIDPLDGHLINQKSIAQDIRRHIAIGEKNIALLTNNGKLVVY